VLEPSSQYKQYRSYAYLDAGVDYPDIPLAKQVGRVPAYAGLDLSPEQVSRTESLLRDNLVISLHDHPSVFPENLQRDMREYIRTGREATGFDGLARSGMTAVFDNVMDGTCCISSDGGWKWVDVLHDLGMRMSDLAHQDYLVKAESLRDIREAHAQDRMAIVFGLEAATKVEHGGKNGGPIPIASFDLSKLTDVQLDRLLAGDLSVLSGGDAPDAPGASEG